MPLASKFDMSLDAQLVRHVSNARGFAGVKDLLDQGASPNATLDWGQTALIWAVKAEDSSVLELLLMRGADIDRQNDRGQTALFMAAACKDEDAAALLLRRGASVDICDASGRKVDETDYCPAQIAGMVRCEREERAEAARLSAQRAEVERSAARNLTAQAPQTLPVIRFKLPRHK